MKKVFLIFSVVAILFSCGRSACECQEEMPKIFQETLSAKMSGDEDAIEEAKNNSQDWQDDCNEYTAEDYRDCE